MLTIVLDPGITVCSELSKSAAGGQELGVQVGHLLAYRLDRAIDVLRQLLIVLHRLQDFILGKSQSTQRSMMSNAAGETTFPLLLLSQKETIPTKRNSFFFCAVLSSTEETRLLPVFVCAA